VFRAQLESSDAKGVLKLAADFDKGSAPPRRKTYTSAPAPGESITGKNVASPDPVNSALKRGNFRDYMEAANRRDRIAN
jgi:hypothetical protein